MDIKNKIIVLVSILLMIVSYVYMSASFCELEYLRKGQYILNVYDVYEGNKWSTFREDGQGVFFIHSGEKEAPRGVFTFKENTRMTMDFSLRSGANSGEIEFVVKHNGKQIVKDIATIDKGFDTELAVRKGDTVEVIADKAGYTDQDCGNLKIETIGYQVLFVKYTVLFLFLILFVYLAIKNNLNIAINAYVIFILLVCAEGLNFGSICASDLLSYALIVFTSAFMFSFAYQEFGFARKNKLAMALVFVSSLFLYVVPLLCIIYILNFDSKVTQDVLFAIFQTNTSESYGYVSDYIHYKYILLFILVPVLIGFLLFLQERKESGKIKKRFLLFVVIAFFCALLLRFEMLRLPKLIIDSVEKYNYELKLFKDVQEKRKANEIVFDASKKHEGETYIVVIGESLNKKHMGLYGYFRNTTPNLDDYRNKGLVVFDNAYSNHTHTVPVLSLSLTEANQYNGKNYYESLSIVEVLKKAGVETYWLTNQNIYGAWDNLVSVIGTSADNLISMNKSIGKKTNTQHFDGLLIQAVKDVLATKTDKNRVVFVHLMGNHGSYHSRYPRPEYEKFKGILALGEFGTEASKVGAINAYDNSVLYNDFVVGSILEEFEKESNAGGFVYIADHADDVIGQRGHNSGKFTYEMAQVPFVMWFNDEYKNQYDNKYKNIKKRTDSLYSNDLLYDTLVGLFGIETDKYNSKYDLTSNNYELKETEALVLHGTKRYVGDDNHIYWQKKNAKYLIKSQQDERIFPHRVNSVGKLHDIWNDGFRAFEVDIEFGNNDKKKFQVGHNAGVMGTELDQFISTVENSEITKMWFDFKNLHVSNYKDALERLNYLEAKYHIKEKVIIESGTKDRFFKEFRDNGYHTSYYMPTNVIVDLLQNRDERGMKKLAKSISSQLQLQQVSAISFDHRLYPFVKEYLEASISKNIDYHIWYSPSLYDKKFKDLLLNNELYLDRRVKIMLSPYKSQFNL